MKNGLRGRFNGVSRNHGAALQGASGSGHREITSLLLESRANPSTEGVIFENRVVISFDKRS